MLGYEAWYLQLQHGLPQWDFNHGLGGPRLEDLLQ